MHTTINHINCKTHSARSLGLLESGPHLSAEDAVPVALCRCRLLMSRKPSSRRDKGFMRLARRPGHGAGELVTSLSVAAAAGPHNDRHSLSGRAGRPRLRPRHRNRPGRAAVGLQDRGRPARSWRSRSRTWFHESWGFS